MNVSLALVLFPLRLSSCVQLHGSQMYLEIVGKGPSSLFPSYTDTGHNICPSSIASSWRQLCLSPIERILKFRISLLSY